MPDSENLTSQVTDKMLQDMTRPLGPDDVYNDCPATYDNTVCVPGGTGKVQVLNQQDANND